MNIDEHERERRSELAKQLNKRTDPITGRPVFGGKQPGAGRPRKRRATERINERIEDHADEIFETMLKALRSGKPNTALAAAKQMVEIVKMETDIQSKEEKSLDNVPTDELMEIVSGRLARMVAAGAIPFDIDGEAVEYEQGAITTGDTGEGESGYEEDESQGTAETGGSDQGSRTSPFARRAAD